jgi:opacity protein-like surface antigen
LLQLGLAPGGSSWVQRGNDLETTQSFGSWNLNAGAGYRLYDKLWVYGGVGLAGLRVVKIESGGDQTRFESKPGAVFTLALQIRP